jgi:hypothetical protein
MSTVRSNKHLPPTAASALRLLAVPSSLRYSAAAEVHRWACYWQRQRFLPTTRAGRRALTSGTVQHENHEHKASQL